MEEAPCGCDPAKELRGVCMQSVHQAEARPQLDLTVARTAAALDKLDAYLVVADGRPIHCGDKVADLDACGIAAIATDHLGHEATGGRVGDGEAGRPGQTDEPRAV